MLWEPDMSPSQSQNQRVLAWETNLWEGGAVLLISGVLTVGFAWCVTSTSFSSITV